MSADGRRCPDSDCEHNHGGRCDNPSLGMLGAAAGASVTQSGMPFTASVGPALMALPAMLEEDGPGVVNSCPRRRKRSLTD